MSGPELKSIHSVKRSIAIKVASATIIFSSLITLIISSHQLYQRYIYDIGVIDSRFRQIQEVNLPSLSNSLWLADKRELRVALEGLLNIPDIQFLEISEDQTIWASAGERQNDGVRSFSLPITYDYKGEILDIGTLEIMASLDNVYNNVYTGIWTVLVSNGIKTFMVAFFMLYIFHNLVIRHLHRITESMDQYKLTGTDIDIHLDRNPNPAESKDEFDSLIDSFNNMHRRLRESFASIEEQIEFRTRELRDAQNTLVQKERLATIGQVTATVSHELRNPLAAMSSSIYILKKRFDPADEKSQQAIARLERGMGRCDRIVDELLSYTRLEKLNLVETDINDWLAATLEEYPIADGIKVTTDFAQDGIKIPIDQELMRRAMVNVIDNACHAMQDESNNLKVFDNAVLTVSTSFNNGLLLIQTKDTGCGMSAEDVSRIFEPLFSTKGFGVGLGMPMVKKIMQQHNGGIDIESRTQHGSTVTLWLRLPGSSLASSSWR